MTDAPSKLPITAIVASHDEAHLLRRCFAPLSFCDEAIVVDLASRDDTVAVAEALGARVLPQPLVPIVEQARGPAIEAARNDWLLILDPDEEIPPPLATQLVETFASLDDDVGLVIGPIQYYFRGRPLAGTAWGGVRWHALLLDRRRIEVAPSIHRRLGRPENVREVRIPFAGDNAVLHHWSSGYRELLAKHRRYLREEGPNRADAGEVAGIRSVATAPFRCFADSFVRDRGYRDGLRGFALSAVWAQYATASELALLRELRRRSAR